jgi:Retinoblastoma-associated protein B domain
MDSPTSTTAHAAANAATTTNNQNVSSLDGDDDANGTSAMRRLRLTVACGAVLLLSAMYENTYPEGEAHSEHPGHRLKPEDRGNGGELACFDEPPGKRIRYSTLAETLVEALNDPSARLNRFGEPHKTSDAFADGRSITADDVEDQAEALAKLVWSVTAVTKPAATKAAARNGVGAAQPSTIKLLWRLETTAFENESAGRIFLLTHRVVPLLARTVDNLYQQTNLRAASANANDDGLLYDVGTLVELDSLDALDDPRRSRLLSRLADEFSSANRTVVTRPVFTEAMELNEWSVSLMSISVVRPCTSLFEMIEATKPGSVMKHIVPILNRVLHRIGEEFVSESMMYRHMSVYVVDTGRVMIYGDDTSDKKFARAVVALYYHALEAILLCEAERLRGSSLALAQGRPTTNEVRHPPRRSVDEILHTRLISSPAFHTALLSCSLLCVHKAVGATQLVMNQLHAFSAMHVCECYPEDFLKVSEAFHRSLWGNTPARGKVGSGLVFGIPRLLWKEVRKAERNTLDTFLWKAEVHSFMGRVEGFREKRFWPPDSLGPDEDDDPEVEDATSSGALSRVEAYKELRSVAYVFRRVLSVASSRIVALLEFLGVNPRPLVARQAYVALRYVLRRHVDLLHDRHLDHMILCCLYGVGKRLKCEPEITFGKLVGAYVAVRGQDEGDVTCQRIVRHIKLVTDVDDTTDEPIGDIIQLYNRVFVPRMKEYLLKSTSLQRAGALLKDPAHTNGRASREAIAGVIQFSIRSNVDRRRASELLSRNNAVTVVEIGGPSSYKAVEVANELTRQGIRNV